MADSLTDDAHLGATDDRMGRALALHDDTPQRRRFARGGEAPVTVIRRDHQPDGERGANQLDAARQAIRSEAAVRERAERSLAEAQVSIRDLQTKLAHERLAKDEALETVRRQVTETQAAAQAQETAEAELAAERLARRNAEEALAEALEARQETEGRLRAMIGAQQAQTPPTEPFNGHGRPKATGIKPKSLTAWVIDRQPHSRAALSPMIVDDGSRPTQTRRRGRPPKVSNQESEVVEWWVPGWWEKLR